MIANDTKLEMKMHVRTTEALRADFSVVVIGTLHLQASIVLCSHVFCYFSSPLAKVDSQSAEHSIKLELVSCVSCCRIRSTTAPISTPASEQTISRSLLGVVM